jgi:hypothetical protein
VCVYLRIEVYRSTEYHVIFLVLRTTTVLLTRPLPQLDRSSCGTLLFCSSFALCLPLLSIEICHSSSIWRPLVPGLESVSDRPGEPAAHICQVDPEGFHRTPARAFASRSGPAVLVAPSRLRVSKRVEASNSRPGSETAAPWVPHHSRPGRVSSSSCRRNTPLPLLRAAESTRISI